MFLSVGEIEKDLKLYELQQDDLLSLNKGENLTIHFVTEDSALPMSGRDDDILVAQKNQPEHEVSPLIQDPLLLGIVGVILHMLRGVILHMLRILHLQEIGKKYLSELNQWRS